MPCGKREGEKEVGGRGWGWVGAERRSLVTLTQKLYTLTTSLVLGLNTCTKVVTRHGYSLLHIETNPQHRVLSLVPWRWGGGGGGAQREKEREIQPQACNKKNQLRRRSQINCTARIRVTCGADLAANTGVKIPACCRTCGRPSVHPATHMPLT